MSNQGNNFVEVAKVSEIPAGKMTHIEINGKEIMLANVDSKFYALSDRCSHTNAPLSMGHLKENIVTCAMHGARFDITTGKKVSDPKIPSMKTDSLPANWQKYVEYIGELLSHIKTYDQDTYKVKVDKI
jgi:nitrite reductase/ring-hydroxylating ferredoxin subunit